METAGIGIENLFTFFGCDNVYIFWWYNCRKIGPK